MAIFGLWVRSHTISLFHSDNIPQVINKAGGLVYQRTFAGTLYRSSFNQSLTSPDGLAQLTSNEYLVLAGTLHGIHAITSRLSPIPGQSSGAQVIEGETFKMNVLLTLTGISFVIFTFLYLSIRRNQIHSLDISCWAFFRDRCSSPEDIYHLFGESNAKSVSHTRDAYTKWSIWCKSGSVGHLGIGIEKEATAWATYEEGSSCFTHLG